MPILAYVLITMNSGSEKTALEQISEFKEVLTADLAIGEYDAIIKVQVDSIPSLDTFLTDRLRSLPDVFLTTTMIVTEQFHFSQADRQITHTDNPNKNKNADSHLNGCFFHIAPPKMYNGRLIIVRKSKSNSIKCLKLAFIKYILRGLRFPKQRSQATVFSGLGYTSIDRKTEPLQGFRFLKQQVPIKVSG